MLSNVTNHWAVLVSTSRYWFNYRHAANALSLYRIVKRLGIPDSRILLLLPDDWACQPRNGQWAGRMFNSPQHSLNLYEEDDVEVDYRGADVTVESFLRLLTGRHEDVVAKSQRLQSDQHSAVLLYLSGHGGNGFLKFQDSEELSAVDLSSALHAMSVQGRFSSMLLLLDTCQAESMAAPVTSPSVLTIVSSRVGQNSYSHSVDHAIGVSPHRPLHLRRPRLLRTRRREQVGWAAAVLSGSAVPPLRRSHPRGPVPFARLAHAGQSVLRCGTPTADTARGRRRISATQERNGGGANTGEGGSRGGHGAAELRRGIQLHSLCSWARQQRWQCCHLSELVGRSPHGSSPHRPTAAPLAVHLLLAHVVR